MTLSRSSGKTSGSTWQNGERLKSSQMNHVEDELVKAIDGVNGGTYTLATSLVIQGQPTTMSGLTVTGGGLTCSAQARFDAGMQVNAAATVADGVTVTWLGTATTHLPVVASRPYYFMCPISPLVNLNSRFTFDNSLGRWVQSDVTDSGVLEFPIVNMPSISGATCTLRDVKVFVDGNGGGSSHGASLPTAMPNFDVYHVSSGGTVTTLASAVTDPSGSVAAYEGAHDISVEDDGPGALAHTPDGIYYVRFRGESGSNKVANALAINSVAVVFDVTKIGP